MLFFFFGLTRPLSQPPFDFPLYRAHLGRMLQRRVQPEILDSLPADHPDALHNRRDLRFFNTLMGNFRWFANTLRTQLREGDNLLELGAGEGDLGRHLRRSLPQSSFTYTGLDLWPQPVEWPKKWSWISKDLSAFPDYAQYNVILGNLILHQFEDEVLANLGRQWREQARLLVFCEPARDKLHLRQLPLARLAGINYVSRHDARVSIEGGFRGRDLPRLLGLDQPHWRITVQHTFLGAYRLVAVREC
jgi:hypothetical protein